MKNDLKNNTKILGKEIVLLSLYSLFTQNYNRKIKSTDTEPFLLKEQKMQSLKTYYFKVS